MGCRVVVLGLREIADPRLEQMADEYHWIGPLRIGEWIRVLSRVGARRAIMAGYVHKQSMYRPFGIWSFLPDWRFIKLWFLDVPDRRNDTVLRAVADILARKGIILDDATRYCQNALATEGVLSRASLTSNMRRDVDFGWRIAKEMGRLDIGQAIAVRDAEVIAVEAIEGTDQMIERAGQLCKGGGWTMIKVAKPDQDMRFDIPTIGPNTIENLYRNGARGLVVEAGKTIIVEKEKTLASANAYGISVVAVSCRQTATG